MTAKGNLKVELNNYEEEINNMDCKKERNVNKSKR